MRHDAEQLQIEVAPAPNAVGRWDVDHEIGAYRRLMGDEALVRQQRLAEQAKECTCGRQAAADALAAREERRPKRLLGWEHKPGCNSYIKQSPKLSPRISMKEQEERYLAEHRADQLRDALARAREEGDLDAEA
jgi:hypothetical protein